MIWTKTTPTILDSPAGYRILFTKENGKRRLLLWRHNPDWKTQRKMHYRRWERVPVAWRLVSVHEDLDSAKRSARRDKKERDKNAEQQLRAPLADAPLEKGGRTP